MTRLLLLWLCGLGGHPLDACLFHQLPRLFPVEAELAANLVTAIKEFLFRQVLLFGPGQQGDHLGGHGSVQTVFRHHPQNRAPALGRGLAEIPRHSPNVKPDFFRFEG